MKGLNHPNIGKRGKGVGIEAAHWGTGTGESGTRGLVVIIVRKTCFLIAVLLLIGSVTLAKSLHLSEHRFPPPKSGDKRACLKVIVRTG